MTRTSESAFEYARAFYAEIYKANPQKLTSRIEEIDDLYRRWRAGEDVCWLMVRLGFYIGSLQKNPKASDDEIEKQFREMTK